MIGIYLLIAVLFLVAGHICKARRWKQLIATYENIDTMRLLRILAIGQGVNMVLPLRVGDVARVYLLGKKHLKNGYVLAVSSVFADMFIDTITVGLALGTLYFLGIHRAEVASVALMYAVISIVLIAVSLLAVWQKKYVKLGIQKVATLFNSNIERKILSVTYTVFANIKDTFRKEKIIKLGLETVGVWTSYFLSYAAFAVFLQKLGFDFTLTGVFQTIFSMAGSAMLVECFKGHQGTRWILWFLVYLMLPLCMVYTVSAVLRLAKGAEAEESHTYRKVLPQLNPADKLAFLNVYFGGKNQSYIDMYLAINDDVSILQDFSAGSNATTILCMDEKNTFYRKYAYGDDAKKLWEQVEWLKKYEESIPLAKIIKEYRTEEYCYYDMEYKRDTLGFFRYIHTSSLEDSWNVLSHVLDYLDENLYVINKREADFQITERYIDQKIDKNVECCKEWGNKKFRKLYNSEYVFINGVSYKNLSGYREMLDAEHLAKVFSGDKYSEIHGDLTIENIVCSQGMTDNWYLIDPNTGSLHETPFLDYAKLLQSLHGRYEFLMMVKNVQVADSRIEFLFTGSSAYQQLYEKYKEYLFERFSYEEVRSIYYHEVVHWLRLMPYKIRKNPDLAVVFYAGLLMVLADVEKMFADES